MRDDYSEMIENLPYDPEVKVMVHCHFDEDADPHLNNLLYTTVLQYNEHYFKH